MRSEAMKKWAVLLLSGSMLLQTPGCVETAVTATAIFSAVSAGGLLFLIRKILQ